VSGPAVAPPALGTPRPTGTPLLEVDDLLVHFRTPRGTLRAVDGVSLRLEPGEMLGLVGESGSGKTVLSRALLGLTPRRAIETISGEVRYLGRDLRGLPERELREVRGREIAMIFQDPMTALNPVMKIGTQIGESLRHHLGLSRAEARRRAVELLDRVGIPSPARRISDYPHQLSGGMRQRVVIAIALSCSPKLLIADEPTTALDVTVQAQILDLLQELQREQRMAVILVSHDLEVVGGRADRIAVMYAGRIVEQATARAVFEATRMPYTEALLRSVPRLDAPSHTRLEAIAGRPPSLTDPITGCRFGPRCTRFATRCGEAEPSLVADAADPDHAYRCWYPVGLAPVVSESDAAGAVSESNAAARPPNADPVD
jgi:oligopeptide/dipeptide ABC transporter ATP-binding protein